YSHHLNRIYVDMLCNFSIRFNWDSSKLAGQPMYVRATTVFSDLAQAEKRVERCFQHAHESSNAMNLSPAVIKNVLRSSREMGTQDVYYCGRPDLADSWYSVLVRLSKPTEHAYHFVCKNSCSSGINRRAIDIIFTLEDAIVGARACSCPRRDILRDEGDIKNKVKTKKPLKVDKQETDMDIVGVRAAISGLRVSLTMMEQARTYKLMMQKHTEAIDRCITHLKALIENLESSLTVKANPP
ncbi:unnamed protein product, partial [Leptidea sinapis]